MTRPRLDSVLRACLCACLFATGCGARSAIEDYESDGLGGSAATTSSSTTSTTTSGSTSTSTSSSTTTTTTLAKVGCADGEREGFLDLEKYPSIAACGGGFQVPGVLGELVPACNWGGGDDGPNPNGAGCSAWDLCQPGWHVCKSALEVAELAPSGCADATLGTEAFFVTRQSGTGCGKCAMGGSTTPNCDTCSCADGCLQTEATSNDVFGCGNMGDPTEGCGVLNAFSNDVCGALGFPWSCGNDGCSEAHAVLKTAPERGGALCCADMLD